MKTSELIKKIDELGYGVRLENETTIIIKDLNGNDCHFLETNENTLYARGSHYIQTKNGLEKMKVIIEYLQTPLEEREEEKKYYLRINGIINYLNYLNYLKDRSEYCISVNASTLKNVQTQFTQKEIDNMPFDTNFFIKEEVK